MLRDDSFFVVMSLGTQVVEERVINRARLKTVAFGQDAFSDTVSQIGMCVPSALSVDTLAISRTLDSKWRPTKLLSFIGI